MVALSLLVERSECPSPSRPAFGGLHSARLQEDFEPGSLLLVDGPDFPPPPGRPATRKSRMPQDLRAEEPARPRPVDVPLTPPGRPGPMTGKAGSTPRGDPARAAREESPEEWQGGPDASPAPDRGERRRSQQPVVPGSPRMRERARGSGV